MATEPPVVFKDLPDTTTPLNAATLNTAMQGAYSNALEAEDAAALAQQYAEEAGAPADDQIAALVANSGSSTRTQLDSRYATASDLASLQQSSASIEDLFATETIVPRGATFNTAISTPVLVAPYPLVITSLALTMWQGTAIATSDTNYWVVDARIMDVGATAHRTFATKTTRTTASGGIPAGEAIGLRPPWTFDTAAFTAPNVAARETVNLNFTPTGTGPTINGPMIVTIGYRPA